MIRVYDESGNVIETHAHLGDFKELMAVGICVLLWRSFFPTYVGKKGENLATKEDIAAITNEVEQVKSFYANEIKQLEHRHERLLEELRSRQQLRMAAVEKRLEAHQQAYMLWRKLRSKVFSGDIKSVVLECQICWESNCLYLALPREMLSFTLTSQQQTIVIFLRLVVASLALM